MKDLDAAFSQMPTGGAIAKQALTSAKNMSSSSSVYVIKCLRSRTGICVLSHLGLRRGLHDGLHEEGMESAVFLVWRGPF